MDRSRNERRSSQPYPAEKARQGRIVLMTPRRRRLFLGGLIGIVVVAILAAILI